MVTSRWYSTKVILVIKNIVKSGLENSYGNVNSIFIFISLMDLPQNFKLLNKLVLLKLFKSNPTSEVYSLCSWKKYKWSIFYSIYTAAQLYIVENGIWIDNDKNIVINLLSVYLLKVLTEFSWQKGTSSASTTNCYELFSDTVLWNVFVILCKYFNHGIIDISYSFIQQLIA